MATVAEKLITAEQFARIPAPADGSKQELVRGVIVAMAPPPGFRHGLRQGKVYKLIDNYATSTKRGRAVVESGVRTEHDPDSVRGPDVSYWSVERLPLELEPVGYPDVSPDLCVEVLSPSNTLKKILDKLHEYFASNVRMVWTVDPETRTVTVYRSADEGRVLHENATLNGDDVLPGFTCRVAEFFE
jgi:Uma2 family endonuclease